MLAPRCDKNKIPLNAGLRQMGEIIRYNLRFPKLRAASRDQSAGICLGRGLYQVYPIPRVISYSLIILGSFVHEDFRIITVNLLVAIALSSKLTFSLCKTPSLLHKMSEIRHSKIACHACRNRKVRCSRELPHCFNCQNCGQPCVYPSVMLKPGPKPGSVHKRRRVENHQVGSPQTPPKKARHEEPKEEQYQSASPIQEDAISEKELQLRCKHIQSVSFLIIQSHESSSPESVRATTPPTDVAPRQCRLISTCNALGVTPDCMKQMYV